jgi:hypothetical protein
MADIHYGGSDRFGIMRRVRFLAVLGAGALFCGCGGVTNVQVPLRRSQAVPTQSQVRGALSRQCGRVPSRMFALGSESPEALSNSGPGPMAGNPKAATLTMELGTELVLWAHLGTEHLGAFATFTGSSVHIQCQINVVGQGGGPAAVIATSGPGTTLVTTETNSCGQCAILPFDAKITVLPATTTPSTSASTPTGSSPPSTTATTHPAVAVGQQLPVSMESDTQMRAEGNNGPTSSILLPSSCRLAGSTVTAGGTYQGGFAPNVYDRYGDIVELYVFGAPSTGYPQGPQLAASSAQDSPTMGSGTWRVSASVDLSVSRPARCVVAAQPTHDVQLAP